MLVSGRFSVASAVCLLFALSCIPDKGPAEDNWPQFRGPSASGVSAGTVLPDVWSETERVAWKTPIPGRGWSSPVVWGEKIFVTTAIKEAGELEEIKNDDIAEFATECLALTETRIDGSGLAAFPRIRTLRLARTPLERQVLGMLPDFPELHGLNLSETDLSDNDLPSLERLHNLRYLNVEDTGLSEEAIDRLRRKLTGCNIERRKNQDSLSRPSMRPGGRPGND